MYMFKRGYNTLLWTISLFCHICQVGQQQLWCRSRGLTFSLIFRVWAKETQTWLIEIQSHLRRKCFKRFRLPANTRGDDPGTPTAPQIVLQHLTSGIFQTLEALHACLWSRLRSTADAFRALQRVGISSETLSSGETENVRCFWRLEINF